MHSPQSLSPKPTVIVPVIYGLLKIEKADQVIGALGTSALVVLLRF